MLLFIKQTRTKFKKNLAEFIYQHQYFYVGTHTLWLLNVITSLCLCIERRKSIYFQHLKTSKQEEEEGNVFFFFHFHDLNFGSQQFLFSSTLSLWFKAYKTDLKHIKTPFSLIDILLCVKYMHVYEYAKLEFCFSISIFCSLSPSCSMPIPILQCIFIKHSNRMKNKREQTF